jgi:hypothetical protein
MSVTKWEYICNLVGKPLINHQLKRRKCHWIDMNLKDVVCEEAKLTEVVWHVQWLVLFNGVRH